jgi:hypothetical protein
MPQEANKLLSDTLIRLMMLSKKFGRVRARVSRDEEDLDAIELELDDLLEDLRRAVTHLLGASVGPTQAPRRVEVTPGPRRQPRDSSRGVAAVVLVAGPNGSAVAQFDGVGIPLPPYVAALLSILMADGGVDPDHLVGWKSVAAIQAALKERTKQDHSKAVVKQLIYRLRSLLERHGENPFLVQNHRRLGYRFAVRRRIKPKTESDNL